MQTATILLGALALACKAFAQCPPSGPTLPLATNLAANPIVAQTIAGISGTLQNYTSSLNASAFPTVYNKSGTHEVTTNTQFVVASISKLFTAYAIKLLSDKVKPSDSILKFVPELLHLKGQATPYNVIADTDWKDITIDSLLSHLSGIAEDLGDSDLDNAPFNNSALGLPTLHDGDHGLQCGAAVNPYVRPCTEHDFFENWGRKFPAYAPYTTPVYSNIGYALLGLVIERVTGRSYADFLHQSVLQPLGLEHTTVDHPRNLSAAVITAETGDGDISEASLAPSGAIYSTSHDLYTFGINILRSEQLSPSATRAWLKPRAFTSSAGTFVGELWEIARGLNFTGRGDGHIVDVYTKGGNLDLYSSLVALVPDFGLVFALTSAGPDTSSAAAELILSEVLSTLVPAIETANKEQAKTNYAGTYTSGANSITLRVDEGPGLVVTNFSANGIPNVVDAVGYTVGGATPGETQLRLYPTDLKHEDQMAWQGVFDTTPAAVAEQEDAAFFFTQASCQSWAELTINAYGLVPLDQFILTAGKDGRNVAVEARAWRSTMTRS